MDRRNFLKIAASATAASVVHFTNAFVALPICYTREKG